MKTIIYTILADNYEVYEDMDKREINKVVKQLKNDGYNGKIKVLKEVLRWNHFKQKTKI